MPKKAKATLIEVHENLNTVLFSILQTLEPDAWKDQSQIVYSTVDDWDTAYQSYLVKNNIEEVKFPFATLTRDPEQEPYAQWNSPLTVNEGPEYKSYEVNGAIIRPVRLKFNWTIYRRDYEWLEQLADLLIVSGSDVQEFPFFSEVLGQDSELSFFFETPRHNMIPAKDDKIRGRGFIFSLTVPIVVDCVLGVSRKQKLIAQIISKYILENIEEVISEEIIDDPDYPLP